MKITKAMITKAGREHFNKEDYKSLVKFHVLSYLYYKQKGDMKTAKRYLTGKKVKQKVKELEKEK